MIPRWLYLKKIISWAINFHLLRKQDMATDNFFSKTWNKVSIYYIFISTYIHHRYCKAVTDYSFSFYSFPILFLFVISSFFFSASQRNKKINILLTVNDWSSHCIFVFLLLAGVIWLLELFFFLLLKNKIKHKGLLQPKERHRIL